MSDIQKVFFIDKKKIILNIYLALLFFIKLGIVLIWGEGRYGYTCTCDDFGLNQKLVFRDNSISKSLDVVLLFFT